MSLCKCLRLYVNVFWHIKDAEYYTSWCKLEEIEIEISWILKNQPTNAIDQFIKFLQERVQCWQSLYPYKVFISPEIKEGRRICNICGLDDTPWSSCHHIPGKIYCGVMCVRIVKDVELLGVAITENPVQKYSVLGVVDDDTEKSKESYELIKKIFEHIHDPFEVWALRWSRKRHPHSFFKEFDSAGLCPCGSGVVYANCCLRTNGVLRPHVDIIFAERDQAPDVGAYVGY